MLGFLWRSLNRCPQQLKKKSYKAIARPKLEYCSCIWDSYQQKYVDQLEMVQRRTERFIKSVPHRRTKLTTSVSAMVSDLCWEWECMLWNHASNLRTPWQVEHVFQDHSRHELPLEYHPYTRHRPAARSHSQQFHRLQPSRCLQ